MPAQSFPNEPLKVHRTQPRVSSRWVIPPQPEGWDSVAVSEWSLTAAGWADHHPHDEVNIVLEGELHVESGGTVVVAGAGDTVVVPAGEFGRYWAPQYARMIAVYGPNPLGDPTPAAEYWEVERDEVRQSPEPKD
ncbi:cupin domain-containing protein [Gordonia sp. KTR9]|uniref:cupin domain-containing protein n=1 Tax=Gordonia sp. KTR9 TaxID=337191 RepID=UPI000299AB21|nr:cupin domain-containing protein [Gordonia sp. KTR9]ADK69001.2 hypothetical protein KTR9_4920 [Gordonia sp. KTR9]